MEISCECFLLLQARFFAPESRQSFVQKMAGNNPVLDLPSAE
jgi:hypothetical protein